MAHDLGCQEEQEQNYNDDDETVITERCFEEKYKGDSRKWLFRDGFGRKKGFPISSTMKDEFQYPYREEVEVKGRRSALLERKLFDEVAEEVIRENNQPPPIEEYCTEYDGNYNAPGYMPPMKDLTQDVELFAKYPLYGSQPTSYYTYQLEKRVLGKCTFTGLSRTLDPKNPFRRYSGFTKPVSEVSEDPCDGP